MATVERSLAGVRTRKLAGLDEVSPALHDFGGNGPLVLFVHATGMHGLAWKPVVDRLIDRAHCVALDLRGHGNTGLPVGAELTGDGFGRDVLGVVRDLFGDGIIGVGHSLGGAALLTAELGAPGTFRQLFLYEPAVHVDVPKDNWVPLLQVRDMMVGLARRRRAAFPSRSAALANYARKPPMADFDPAALSAYVEYGFADISVDGVSMVELKCSPAIEAQIYASIYDLDLADRLTDIECPTLVATGSNSPAVHRAMVPALASRLGSAPVVLDGVSHFAPMQNPQQFAIAVARHALA